MEGGSWCYRDLQRKQQGPFPTSQMQLWWKNGYFPPNTVVFPEGTTEVEAGNPISSVGIICGNADAENQDEDTSISSLLKGLSIEDGKSAANTNIKFREKGKKSRGKTAKTEAGRVAWQAFQSKQMKQPTRVEAKKEGQEVTMVSSTSETSAFANRVPPTDNIVSTKIPLSFKLRSKPKKSKQPRAPAKAASSDGSNPSEGSGSSASVARPPAPPAPLNQRTQNQPRHSRRHQRYLVVDTSSWIDEAFNLTTRRTHREGNEDKSSEFELNKKAFFQGLATTDVKIVLPDQVIRELDGLKDRAETNPLGTAAFDSTARRGQLGTGGGAQRILSDTAVRARRAIAALRDAQRCSSSRSQHGDSVAGAFIVAEAGKASRCDHHIGMEADQRILDCATKLRRRLKASANEEGPHGDHFGADNQVSPPRLEVVLITSDVNLQLLAGLGGEDREPLRALSMSEFKKEIYEREAAWQRAYRSDAAGRAIEAALCMSAPAAAAAPNNDSSSTAATKQ